MRGGRRREGGREEGREGEPEQGGDWGGWASTGGRGVSGPAKAKCPWLELCPPAAGAGYALPHPHPDPVAYSSHVALTHPCRTFDPEEADFFYVPQYSTCFIYPIHGWADYPWFPVPGLGEGARG